MSGLRMDSRLVDAGVALMVGESEARLNQKARAEGFKDWDDMAAFEHRERSLWHRFLRAVRLEAKQVRPEPMRMAAKPNRFAVKRRET